MRNTRGIRLAIAALAGLIAAATSARADSVLANGFFDTPNLSAWQVTGGTLGHDAARDADGFVSSGSARGAIGATATGASASLGQCVAIGAGPAWFAAAKVRYKQGQTATGYVALRYEFFASAGCTGTSLGDGVGSLVPSVVRGIWLDLTIGDFTSGVAPSAGNVKSVRLAIQLVKDDAGGPLTVNVDDVTLARVGTPLCRGRAATIFGTDAPEKLTGTAGDDVIVGLGGNDRIYGGGGNDLLCGDDGNDRIYGGNGKDYLEGGRGSDLLKGGPNPDVLLAGEGNDRIYGGAGDDVLDDGPGEDLCKPGPGDTAGEGFCDGPV